MLRQTINFVWPNIISAACKRMTLLHGTGVEFESMRKCLLRTWWISENILAAKISAFQRDVIGKETGIDLEKMSSFQLHCLYCYILDDPS